MNRIPESSSKNEWFLGPWIFLKRFYTIEKNAESLTIEMVSLKSGNMWGWILCVRSAFISILISSSFKFWLKFFYFPIHKSFSNICAFSFISCSYKVSVDYRFFCRTLNSFRLRSNSFYSNPVQFTSTKFSIVYFFCIKYENNLHRWLWFSVVRYIIFFIALIRKIG